MDKKNELNEYIKKALCNYDLPGLAVGADIFGEFTYTAAAGYKDMPDRAALKAEHIFHYASVSKLFTGMSVLKLEEEGLLGLDDDITEYFGFLPFSDVTIKKLLTHTAGLGDVNDYEWDRPRIDTHALGEYIASDEVKSAQTFVQDEFRYSNIGYEILGSLVSELSGLTYEEYVKENFLDPAGMDGTTFLTFRRSESGSTLDEDDASPEEVARSLDIRTLGQEGVCTPHVKDEDRMIVREKHFPYNRMHGPSSTLTSNLYEMRKWAGYIMEEKALNKETYNKMWQQRAIIPNNGEHIGLSWFIREQNGRTLYGHEGTDSGFRSSFWICPDLKAQVTVTSNITKAPVKKINKHVFDILTR